MTTVVAERSSRGLAGSAEERRLHDGRRAAGGESTLEQLILGVWEDLAARPLAVCPVCSDEMRVVSAGALTAACRGCGSELS